MISWVVSIPLIKEISKGVKVAALSRKYLRSASVVLLVGRGSHEDTVDGCACLSNRMRLRLTSRFKPLQLQAAMDRLGATVQATTDRDLMLLSIQVPSTKVAESVKFMAELRASSSFPALEVAKERTSQILEYEKIRQDPILASISDSWEATFPESPLGHPVTGYPETVEKLTPKILEKFDADTKQEASLVMAIVGPQDENKLIDHARASFKEVQITPRATKLKFEQTRDVNVLRRVLEVKQTTFSVGIMTQGVSAHDYPALLLVQDYLGSSSRRYVGVLFNELREKKGLTYIASTDLTALRECGLLTAYASAKHEKISDALSLMLRLIVGLRDEAVPHNEVEQLKIFHKRVVGMMLDVPNQAAMWLATNVFRGGKITFESYVSEIDSVTPEAMRLAARKLLKPSHMALSVAGRPPDEKTLTNIMRSGLQ